ncbi:MAG: hypothetical protein N2504_05620 [candidate division WOR-3 bacterium]|nr:hypothetical protein [candidate division WOR-3 bacterium]MCX7948048.1 hypothetical protein [candidate division WOR-3 bacterium]MDW8151014.1 hypothetical protein [candidate division WOR-3 bacterium]
MFLLILIENCKCEPLTYIKAIENADASFEGLVIDIKEDEIVSRVINPIKQINDSIIIIKNDKECAYNFEKNKLYRFFLKKKDNYFITNKCMGNSYIEEYEEYRDYSE